MATTTQEKAALILQDRARVAAEDYAKQLTDFTKVLKDYAAVTVNTPATRWGSDPYAKWGNLVPTIIDSAPSGASGDGLSKLVERIGVDTVELLDIPEAPKLNLPSKPMPLPSIEPPQYEPVTAPTVGAFTAPTLGNIEFHGTAPKIDIPKMPVRPADWGLPDKPSFADIVMPSIDSIVVPTFHGLAPTDELLMPTNLFMFEETEYKSTMLDDWTARTAKHFEDGNYGLNEADEKELLDRERDRQMGVVAMAQADAARTAGSRGFSMPPGALAAQLASAIQAGMAIISTASRDITIKRADMYTEHMRFNLGQMEKLEDRKLKMHLLILERALNVSKIINEFGITLFNSKVARFNALNDGFKTSIAEYEAKVRGELSKAESQKLKLQATGIAVDIQKNQAQLYTAQLDAARMGVEVYVTDVKAAQSLIEVERLKVDIFRAEVGAFTEMLKVDTVKLQGFEAQVRGDLASVEVYKAQLSAETTKADFARAQSTIHESNARIEQENVKLGIAVAEASANIYSAQTRAIASSNESGAHAFAARTDAYRAMASVYESAGKLGVAQFEATSKVGMENARNQLEQQKGVWDVRMKAAQTGSDVLGRAMQAAMNQVIGIATSAE